MRYPDKRLIVFAGVNREPMRMDALKKMGADSLMVSFDVIKKSNRDWWLDECVPKLGVDGWNPLVYLDSGAFSFLRVSSGSRITTVSQPSKVKDSLAVKKMPYWKSGRLRERVAEDSSRDEVKLVDYMRHRKKYLRFLETHIDTFDFVFELDMDLLWVVNSKGKRIPGRELTDAGRIAIHKIAGDKMIPVWHQSSVDGLTVEENERRFLEMIDNHPYVAIGSGTVSTHPHLRYLCHEAHAKGVYVHGLGTSKTNVLDKIPYDSVDSTTWLSSMKFGQFAGYSYPRDMQLSPRSRSRAAAFEKLVRELGYDPKRLLNKDHANEQCEVAIALMLRRQEKTQAMPIPRRRPKLL